MSLEGLAPHAWTSLHPDMQPAVVSEASLSPAPLPPPPVPAYGQASDQPLPQSMKGLIPQTHNPLWPGLACSTVAALCPCESEGVLHRRQEAQKENRPDQARLLSGKVSCFVSLTTRASVPELTSMQKKRTRSTMFSSGL